MRPVSRYRMVVIFTTEVWRWRGLVTYYTVVVIDLASRRVQIIGLTPHPDEAFMRQVGRTLTAADDGMLVGDRMLICDRDRKWSLSVRQRLEESGVRVVQTPFQASNANAYAERFVRSIKHEWRVRRSGEAKGRHPRVPANTREHEHDSAGERRDSEHGRQRYCLLSLGRRVKRPHVHDGLAAGVRDA